MMPPWLWVIAGPNGAGKMTLAQRFLAGLPQLNPDTVARRLDPDHPERMALSAGREVVRLLGAHLESGESFGWETTLTGSLPLRVIRAARAQGWHIGLVYIGLRSAAEAIKRVEARHRRGGHFVPPADVRRRYRASLANLPVALALADAADVHDNSGEGGPVRILEARNGVIARVHTAPPRWLRTALHDTALAVGASIAVLDD